MPSLDKLQYGLLCDQFLFRIRQNGFSRNRMDVLRCVCPLCFFVFSSFCWLFDHLFPISGENKWNFLFISFVCRIEKEKCVMWYAIVCVSLLLLSNFVFHRLLYILFNMSTFQNILIWHNCFACDFAVVIVRCCCCCCFTIITYILYDCINVQTVWFFRIERYDEITDTDTRNIHQFKRKSRATTALA